MTSNGRARRFGLWTAGLAAALDLTGCYDGAETGLAGSNPLSASGDGSPWTPAAGPTDSDEEPGTAYYVSCSAPDGLDGTSPSKPFDSLDDLDLTADSSRVFLRGHGCAIKGDMVLESPAHAQFELFDGDELVTVEGSLLVECGASVELEEGITWPEIWDAACPGPENLPPEFGPIAPLVVDEDAGTAGPVEFTITDPDGTVSCEDSVDVDVADAGLVATDGVSLTSIEPGVCSLVLTLEPSGAGTTDVTLTLTDDDGAQAHETLSLELELSATGWSQRSLFGDVELDGDYAQTEDLGTLRDWLTTSGGYIRWTGGDVLIDGPLEITSDSVLDLGGATLSFDDEVNASPWNTSGIAIAYATAFVHNGTIANTKHPASFQTQGAGALIDLHLRDSVADGVSVWNSAGAVGIYDTRMTDVGWNHPINSDESQPGKGSMAHGVYKRGSARLEVINLDQMRVQGWAIRIKHQNFGPDGVPWSSDHHVRAINVHHAYGLLDLDQYVESTTLDNAVLRDVSLLLHERASRNNAVTNVVWLGTSGSPRYLSHYVTGSRETVEGPRMSVSDVTYVTAVEEPTFDYGLGQSGAGIDTPMSTQDLTALGVTGFERVVDDAEIPDDTPPAQLHAYIP